MRAPSSTKVSGQTAFIKSLLSTIRPALRTSTSKVSATFGGSEINSPPRRNNRSPASMRYGPNSYPSIAGSGMGPVSLELRSPTKHEVITEISAWEALYQSFIRDS